MRIWLLKVVTEWGPVVGPLVGGGALLSFVKSLIDLRVTNSERATAQREAEILAKLPQGGDAYRRLLDVLDRRTRRWHRKERRRSLIGASGASVVVIAASLVYLYLLDQRLGPGSTGLVSVVPTLERWNLALSIGSITWTSSDSLVAIGIFGLIFASLYWFSTFIWFLGSEFLALITSVITREDSTAVEDYVRTRIAQAVADEKVMRRTMRIQEVGGDPPPTPAGAPGRTAARVLPGSGDPGPG